MLSKLSNFIASHLVSKSFKETYLDPRHLHRTESEEFRNNRETLIKAGYGCLICGTRDNLQGHHIFPWAEWHNLDPAKMLAMLRIFDIYGYAKSMGNQPITSPHDIRNLMMLCEDHHIGTDGIHRKTGPLWLCQAATKDGVRIFHG